MPVSNLRDWTDEKLVALVNGPSPDTRRIEAGLELERRYRPVLCGRFRNEIRNPAQFLAAVKCSRIEDFCADVLGKAIRTYRRGHGARFSTWLYQILTREIISGFRLRKPPMQATGPDGQDFLGDLEARGGPGGGLEPLAFQEAIDLARACLEEMDPRWQMAFVWGHFLQMSNEEIRGVWPHESLDNVKQLKSRAAARFVVLWHEKGGARAEELLQNLAGAVAEKIDPRRIRKRRVREAYLLWMRRGSLVAAARELKMGPARLRSLLLEAMHDLFGQVFRGETLDPAALRACEGDLARYLELSEAARPGDAVLARLQRTLDLVRAAFGFAPPGTAAQTLGSFVQSRLSREEDYDSACRELGLRPAALRRLLADQAEPERELFARLSRFLEVPEGRLRALPRRPAGETALLLRSRSGFDDERFRERVLAWIRKK